MLMKTYNRFPVTFVKGSGCVLYDENGKEYLDLSSGIGVNSVGHAHPKWVSRVTEQAGALSHASNLYNTRPAERLARRILDVSGLENGSVFFANSGAEANEGMIKLARKYSHDKYGSCSRSTIVTLNKSFHGRTVTTLAATGQDKLHKHFYPFTEGFAYVPPEDIEAVKAVDGVCAVIAEPVQGEGGVFPMSGGYMRELSELCAERDWLLMLDEVQTGIGRCGTWFAYQGLEGVKPDVISFAKGIGGGLPIGGFIAGEKCADVLGMGDHGSTYGGNPVCCAGALAVLEIINDILPDVNAKGELFVKGLSEIRGLSGARGKGLMVGADIDGELLGTPRKLAEKLLDAGAVCLTAGEKTLRLLPPLIISNEEIYRGLEIIRSVCQK